MLNVQGLLYACLCNRLPWAELNDKVVTMPPVGRNSMSLACAHMLTSEPRSLLVSTVRDTSDAAAYVEYLSREHGLPWLSVEHLFKLQCVMKGGSHQAT